MNINESTPKSPQSVFELYSLPYPIFAVAFVIVFISAFLGVMPGGMIGAFAFMIALGTVLNEAGERLPIVNTYLGGGPIVIIFGSSALVYFGLINDRTINIIGAFMHTGATGAAPAVFRSGFLDFYIAALITGSILGMNRSLLVRAFFGYIPAILGAIAVAFAFSYAFGALTGFGGMEGLFMIGVPVMAGGMGAGAVPLSTIYASHTGGDAAAILSVMVPAVALANAIAIIFGGLLDTVGKKFPSLTGNGQLMKGFDNDSSSPKEGPALALNVKNLGVGLFLSVSFFCLGSIIGWIIPAVHAYAWMIIMVAITKVVCWLPEKIEACCFQWFQFIMTNLTTTLLVGIGVSFTNLQDVINAFTPIYLFLVFMTVIGAMIGAAIVGTLVRYYMIEAIITAGLCMANMGGTGDVATLSAAKRMELMPFAQISSRIGGAMMLLIASLMLGIFNFGG